MNKQLTDMMTIADIAARLGISRSRAYQLAASHTIPCVRQGKTIRIPRIAWERWLVEQAELALDGTRGAETSVTEKEVKTNEEAG